MICNKLGNIIKWNWDNIDEGEDFLEGIKTKDFNEGLSILEGKAQTDNQNNYIKLLEILDKKYPKSTWLFLYLISSNKLDC